MIYKNFEDILRGPFEFDGSRTGFQVLEREIDQTREAYQLTRVIVGIETTAHHDKDLVSVCGQQCIWCKLSTLR